MAKEPQRVPELPGVEHRFVALEGVRLHVALSGPADAPVLVLVHGWPQNWWAWRRLIPRLSQDHRLVVPDMRGFGWSEAPRSGYGKDELAADLLGLMDALGIERATWIGHDWGGYAGMLALLAQPERFDRALIMGTPHLWGPLTDRWRLAYWLYQVPLSLPLIAPVAARPMMEAVLRYGRRGDRLSRSDLRLFAGQIPIHVTKGIYRSYITRDHRQVRRGRFANQTLAVPTTVLLAKDDVVTYGIPAGPVPGQPNLTVEHVPDGAHGLPEMRPADIESWVVSRKSRTSSASSTG